VGRTGQKTHLILNPSQSSPPTLNAQRSTAFKLVIASRVKIRGVAIYALGLDTPILSRRHTSPPRSDSKCSKSWVV